MTCASLVSSVKTCFKQYTDVGKSNHTVKLTLPLDYLWFSSLKFVSVALLCLFWYAFWWIVVLLWYVAIVDITGYHLQCLFVWFGAAENQQTDVIHYVSVYVFQQYLADICSKRPNVKEHACDIALISFSRVVFYLLFSSKLFILVLTYFWYSLQLQLSPTSFEMDGDICSLYTIWCKYKSQSCWTECMLTSSGFNSVAHSLLYIGTFCLLSNMQ